MRRGRSVISAARIRPGERRAGRPELFDRSVIPLAALKESINKAAYGCTDKHVGPKEEKKGHLPPATSAPR